MVSITAVRLDFYTILYKLKDHCVSTGAIVKLVAILKTEGLLRAELAISDDPMALDVKINGLIQLPGGLMRRIDILGVPIEEMPAALIYFTGNDIFNRSLRLKARHMGYSLNQRYLSDGVTRMKDGTKTNAGTLRAKTRLVDFSFIFFDFQSVL